MRITWRERLEQRPILRNFRQWPMIPLQSIPRSRQRSFLRNQQIVSCALDGMDFETIARQHNVNPSRISQLLDRCLGGNEHEDPALTKGLIPSRLVAKRIRTSPLATLTNSVGSACAFRDLLERVPGLREGLDAVIVAKLKDAPYAQRLTPQALHGEFKRLLVEANWPRDLYPYTTASQAYQSVRRYLHRRIDELEIEHLSRKSTPTRDIPATQTGRAMRAIQIDEHTLDLKGRVHLVLNDVLIPLRVARACVLTAIDVDTECVLGYHLVATQHPNQQDLLTLIDKCIRPWRPLALKTPGLSYEPGACFPNGLDDAYPLSFGLVQLDNALMHKAHSVRYLLCEQYGATTNFGRPHVPTVRYQIESVFDFIGENFTHRVASTTGSHPKDDAKESRKNQKAPPRMSFQTIDEALSIILTSHNIRPKPALGGASSLALFNHQCKTHYVRFVPQFLACQWQPLTSSKIVELHWSKREHRVPHVNFYYCRYQGPGLTLVADKSKRVRVVFDRRDIRKLHAYTLDGEDLGEIIVSRNWRRFPHTLATRAWIHKYHREFVYDERDPLSSYFHHLLDHKNKERAALSLLRVYTEFAGDTGSYIELGDTLPRTDVLGTPNPRWRIETAYHQR
jgi:putative transposase